jgi:hypothetical protein
MSKSFKSLYVRCKRLKLLFKLLVKLNKIYFINEFFIAAQKLQILEKKAELL